MNPVAGMSVHHLSFHILRLGSYARVVVVTRFIPVSRVLTMFLYMLTRPCMCNDVLQVLDALQGMVDGAVQQLRARSCFPCGTTTRA